MEVAAGGVDTAAAGALAAGARAGAVRPAAGRDAPVADGVGSGMGCTIAEGAGVGAGAGAGRGVGVWPEGGRSKSRTGGVITVGAVLFCAAAGGAESINGISAVVARRDNAVTARALA